jgi:hypothetical protein
LGELNGSAQARWLKTIEVFNEQGESRATSTVSAKQAPSGFADTAAILVLSAFRVI